MFFKIGGHVGLGAPFKILFARNAVIPTKELYLDILYLKQLSVAQTILKINL